MFRCKFLIETELKKFKKFLDTDFFYTRKNFREKGFVWITTGKVILVEDFFLIKDFLYYPKFPLDIEGLEFCWNSAYHDLEQAAKGGAEGLYVQFLKEKKIEINTPKLENINEPLPEKIQTNSNLVKWKGTPGEFGAIFDLLIDNGFIELIKDKKNMVRLLHSLFEIKNDKGEITNSDYLYKCFKDKIKSYPNGYLKIPLSDNYHNDK